MKNSRMTSLLYDNLEDGNLKLIHIGNLLLILVLANIFEGFLNIENVEE